MLRYTFTPMNSKNAIQTNKLFNNLKAKRKREALLATTENKYTISNTRLKLNMFSNFISIFLPLKLLIMA